MGSDDPLGTRRHGGCPAAAGLAVAGAGLGKVIKPVKLGQNHTQVADQSAVQWDYIILSINVLERFFYCQVICSDYRNFHIINPGNKFFAVAQTRLCKC